ncbi:MAG: 1-acyl-sn-glycerol-3-phosphate acyltransferase [Bacteroidales bacterium]|nr:1-acyl-sn-glycerol-3-phosphate acyltransferase [Bacteroidales bacterium]
MRTTSGYILYNILGWKIKGVFPGIKKSILIIAPHTSVWDWLIVTLFLNQIGVKYKILYKKEFLIFPINIVMKLLGSIPVDRKGKRNNLIFQIAGLLKNNEELCIALSPEGTRYLKTQWEKGFYYISKRTNVPIIAGYIDYTKKEIGIKGVIHETDNIKTVMQEINECYQNVGAKHPEKFSLDIADKENLKGN